MGKREKREREMKETLEHQGFWSRHSRTRSCWGEVGSVQERTKPAPPLPPMTSQSGGGFQLRENRQLSGGGNLLSCNFIYFYCIFLAELSIRGFHKTREAILSPLPFSWPRASVACPPRSSNEARELNQQETERNVGVCSLVALSFPGDQIVIETMWGYSFH